MTLAAPPPDQHRDADGWNAPVGEPELKFVLPWGQAASVRRWLAQVCRPDRVHPVGTVSTVYYDTPGRASLDEKLNSDYYKTKVRVRWYEPPDGPASEAFVEVKRKVGALRRKIRVPTGAAGTQLDALALHDPAWIELIAPLRPHGVRVAALRPLLLLRYDRYRFVDPATGGRVSLDTDIRVVRANARLLPRRGPVAIETAVVEIKGLRGERAGLPPTLAGLLGLGLRQASFSKFAVGYLELARVVV